jgi:di/tricarboxylate transporter
MKEQLKDRVTLILAGALLAFVLVEAVVVPHYHPVFPWHSLPGYSAIIGLVGCIVVVQLSKWLGKALLQQPEEEE